MDINAKIVNIFNNLCRRSLPLLTAFAASAPAFGSTVSVDEMGFNANLTGYFPHSVPVLNLSENLSDAASIQATPSEAPAGLLQPGVAHEFELPSGDFMLGLSFQPPLLASTSVVQNSVSEQRDAIEVTPVTYLLGTDISALERYVTNNEATPWRQETIWLAASGLFGFVTIARRRKIPAASPMAAA